MKSMTWCTIMNTTLIMGQWTLSSPWVSSISRYASKSINIKNRGVLISKKKKKLIFFRATSEVLSSRTKRLLIIFYGPPRRTIPQLCIILVTCTCMAMELKSIFRRPLTCFNAHRDTEILMRRRDLG